jgi:hypothetical protein
MTPEDTPSVSEEQPGDSAVGNDRKDEEYLPPREKSKAPSNIKPEVTEENIIEGPRRRVQRREKDFVYQTRLAHPEEKHIFNAMLADGLLHKDQLSPLPQSMRQAMKHPLKDGWIEAAERELRGLETHNTFEKVNIPEGKQVIPVKWVFHYKCDSNGYLIKQKARICVRGDLQANCRADTYAATLTSRVFRMCMAITAVFDLDARQYDVMNAFLNSELDEEVYVRMPDGFAETGQCWKLRKALYGLRRSPRLWYLELGSWLKSRGFKQVLEEPCVFTTEYAILIFYVDDIVVLSMATNRHQIQGFEDALSDRFPTRIIGQLDWFLGIRVLRDREARKLWLSQDSYINKIVHRFHLEEGKRPTTPLAQNILLSPNEGKAKPEIIHQYQAKSTFRAHPSNIWMPSKALPPHKHQEFVRMLGLKDIRDMITAS